MDASNVFLVLSLSLLSLKIGNCLPSNKVNIFASVDDPLPVFHDSTWHITKVSIDKAHLITEGLNTFSVGFIDSGIDGSIAYLSQNIDEVLSVDCLNNHVRDPLTDLATHGTCVASLFGAANNPYVFGVTHNSSMVSLRSDQLYSPDSPDTSAVLYALDYINSYQSTIKIFNCSVQVCYWSDSELNQLVNKLSSFSGLGVIVAGNSLNGINLDNYDSTAFDAFRNLPNVILVGASNLSDNRCSFSNYGENTVDLFAPGENLATFPVDFLNDNEPNWFSGTCAAAPLVTGTASLMLSVNPNLTSSEIKQLIISNVDYDTNLDNMCVSDGRLNTFKAVRAAIPEITTFNSYVNAIQPLDSDEYQFYKISLTPGNYVFETSGNLFTTGYLYNSDIEAGPFLSSTNQSGNFSLSLSTIKNRTVYLKVKNNSTNSGSYNVKVLNNHSHNYTNNYIWYDGYFHKAFCSCGQYQLKPHIIGGGISSNCLFCGGSYSGPLLSPFSNSVIVGNDSLLLNNGVVVLGNIDYNLFLIGQLDLDTLEGGPTL